MKVKKLIIKGCYSCPFNVDVYDASFKEVDSCFYYCGLYEKHTNSEMSDDESAFDAQDEIWEAISEELPEDEANDWMKICFDNEKYLENWKPSFCEVKEISIALKEKNEKQNECIPGIN